MIRCSTLHDLQCLCHQKYCTIPGAYSNYSSFFTYRLRQSWHKNTRLERNCIPGMLNSVPFRTAALGTAQKKENARQFRVMGPFRNAVSSLTRAFSLHKIHIYWNKRKGSLKKDPSGPLSEISASRTEISLSAHHFT